MNTLSIVFSAVVALSTGIYAYYTYRLTNETVMMRHAQTDAHIGVSVGPRPEYVNLLEMAIKNYGPGPAKEIRFSLDHDITIQKKPGMMLSDIGLFEHGIPYFAPGQEYRFFLLNVLDEPELLCFRPPLTITISYETVGGESRTDQCTIDFRAFRGMRQLGEPDSHVIAKAAKRISDKVDRLTTGHEELRVVTQTKAEYDAAESARLEQVRERLASQQAQRQAGMAAVTQGDVKSGGQDGAEDS